MSQKVSTILLEIACLLKDEPGVHTISELSERFDIAGNTIQKLADDYSLVLFKRDDKKVLDRREIIRKQGRFLTAHELAEMCGVTASNIRGLAKRMGLPLKHSKLVFRKHKPGYFDYDSYTGLM